MSTLTVKGLKLTNFHRAAKIYRKIRCSRSLSAYECRHFVQNVLTTSSRRYLSTVAHKFDREDPLSRGVTDAPKSIDEAFSRIDSEVRRTGRTNARFVRQVFDQIKSSGTASSLHGLYLLRCCGRLHADTLSRKILLINDIWKTLNELSTPLNIDHYNALLKVYLQNDVKFSPMEILSEMEKQNVHPNNVTYQLFVEKFCREGDFSGASVILEYMKEKNFAINEDVFNSLIKCHAKANDMEGAKNMLDVMRKSNLHPSAKTFTILACAYAEAGDIEGVNDALLKAQESGTVLYNENYIEIITSFAVGGLKDHIDKLMQRLYVAEEERQEFITAIMNLIYKGFDDVAYKFFLLLGQSNFQTTCNLFVKLLTKSEKPVETIIGYCEEFEKQGCNPLIYLYAAKVAIDYNLTDHAMGFFKEMQQRGVPVRGYFFSDILSRLKEGNKFEETWKVLKMMYEFGVPSNFDINYNCANLAVKNNMDPADVIAKFEACGHEVSSFINPLFHCYCEHFKLDQAKYIMQRYPVKVGTSFRLDRFISSYNASKDKTEIFLEILEHMTLVEMENSFKVNGASKFLVKLMKLSIPIFEDLLVHLNKKDIKLNREDIVILQDAIVEWRAPHLIKLLQKQSSSDFGRMNEFIEDNEETINKLEENLLRLRENDESTVSTLYKLLLLYVKQKDLSRVSDIITELENQNFMLAPTIYSQLINLYAVSQDLEMAEKLFAAMKDHCPDFKLDGSKLLNYVTSLVMHEKHNEAVQILETELKNTYPTMNHDLLMRSIKRLLNSASEIGDVSLVKNLHKSISATYKFVAQEASFFEPFIKAHLVRDNLDGAIEEYRECAKDHRVFPCKGLLLRRCIYAEDPTLLQRVVDVTIKFAGESAALCELASVFLEIGRTAQATKIFQNLGRKTELSHLEKICDRFFQQNKDVELSQLILITQDLWHIDREKLYHYLFQLYDKRNDYINALEVWTLFKRENLQPSEKTQELLSNLLKRNSQPLPFEERSPIDPVEQVPHISTSSEVPTEVASFLKCVDAGQITEALEMLPRMKKGHVRSIPLKCMTNFIDSLVKQNKFRDLSLLVQPMTYIIDNSNEIFKPLFKEYADDGDVDAFHQLQSSLPDFLLKHNYYNYYVSNAYIVSQRFEDLLSELEKRCDKKNKLFSVYAFQELLKVPELEERVLNLAKRYMDEINFDVPLSVIWAHHFKNEDYSRAEDFYKVYSVDVAKVESIIVKSIRNDQNVKLGRKYVDLLIQFDLGQEEKEKAYRCLLDVLVFKGMYREASNLIGECERQKVPLNFLSRKTLITLENALKSENVQVTFSIPEQNKDSDSSSSDSE